MRKEILNLLANRSGEYVSGESISQTLNITRAAVWKQIQALKESGYAIEAQTKNGYRLLENPLSLEEWVLEQGLKTRNLNYGIHCFNELPSTNDYAKELIRQGIENPGVVVARRQTAGRGRLQRAWESPEGGIWMSVMLRPKLSLADAAKLTLSAGVALAQVCRKHYGLRVQIKWPNDIVMDGEKLAGILGEVVGEWNTVQTLILGIGINANLKRGDIPSELPATTLQEQLGHPLDLNELVLTLLEELETEVRSLEQGDFAGLRERWLSCAAGIGQEVYIERAGQVFRGIFKGISLDGELILLEKDRESLFTSGDVKMRSMGGYAPR